MREIKFRGFRNFKGNALYPPDKRWIYGYYYFHAGKHWIKNRADMTQAFMVEEDSLGEFTGLKDRNSKEIWEGDIVNLDSDGEPDPSTATYVKWIDGGFWVEQIEFKKWMEENKYGAWVQLSVELEGIEIIGNIYENPDLLQ